MRKSQRDSASERARDIRRSLRRRRHRLLRPPFSIGGHGRSVTRKVSAGVGR